MIPSTLIRNEAVYRTYGVRAQRIGCGFWIARPDADEVAVRYPFFALGWVLRGEAEHVDASGLRRALRPGDAYLRFPGVEHSTLFQDPGYAECWIDLGGELATFPEAAGLVQRDRPVLRPGIDLSLLRRLDRTLASARVAEESALPLIAADFVAMVAALARLDRRERSDPYRDLVDEACRLLDSGPLPRWRLAHVARRHGLSYERFRKVFAERLGCGPRMYGLRRRLDRARGMLLEGRKSVSEIAEELGYASASSFSLRFRDHVGHAPSRFRDQGR
jgi:AraC-like DNA-binding protein